MIAQADVHQVPLPRESVDMVFSDPPYLSESIPLYGWVARESKRILKPGKFVAVMCGGNGLNRIMRWFDEVGLDFYWLYQLKMQGSGCGMVWRWANGVQQPIIIRTKHVLVYSKGGAISRTPTISLHHAGGADKRWHHWGQDIDSHRYYIDCFSDEGDLVCDPMVGGGTSYAAAKLLGRRFVGFDIDNDALVTTRCRLNGGNGETFDGLPLFDARVGQSTANR